MRRRWIDALGRAVLAVVDGNQDGPGKTGAREEEKERGPEEREQLRRAAWSVSRAAVPSVSPLRCETHDGRVKPNDLEDGKLARAKRGQDPAKVRVTSLVVHLVSREAWSGGANGPRTLARRALPS